MAKFRRFNYVTNRFTTIWNIKCLNSIEEWIIKIVLNKKIFFKRKKRTPNRNKNENLRFTNKSIPIYAFDILPKKLHSTE